MITFTDLQNKLATSIWPQPSKEKLSALAPSLGTRLLDYLVWLISQPGSYINAEVMAETVATINGWHALLLKKDTEKVLSQIIATLRTNNHFAEKAVFYAVMDIRANDAIARNVPAELSRLFGLLECIYFDRLFPKEITQLLKNRAALIASFADLSEEVKRYYYLRGLEENEGRELEQFKWALEQNQEEIGTDPLTLLMGPSRPTVANWLKAFAEMRSKTAVRSTYNIAFFVTNHPVAVRLSDADKAVVADLLRLYAWILRPEIFPEEINHYHDERKSYYDSVKQDLLELTMVGEPAVTTTAPAMTPPGLPVQTETNGVVLGGQKPTSSIAGGKFQPPAGDLTKMMQLGEQTGSTLGGLVMSEGTNIKIDKEAERLQQERSSKLKSIQNKLEELRRRNNTN